MSGPETRLRNLLEIAAGDPPRSVSVSEVRRRARRRKTVHGVAAISAAATVSAIAVAAIVIPGALQNGAAGPIGGPTAYVATSAKTVVAINLTTSTVLNTIRLNETGGPVDMAVTPNGQRVYVLSAPPPTPAAKVPGRGEVTPISTATDRAGHPIRLQGDLQQILITPNGHTAYVLARDAGLVPIDLGTGQPLPEIKVRGAGGEAMMPNGKTIYVQSGDEIVPVDLSTGKALTPITAARPEPLDIGPVISPDGTRLYSTTSMFNVSGPPHPWSLLPVNTATNRALKPIVPKNFFGLQLAFGAGGGILYVAGFNSALPVDTRTGKPLKQIRLPGASDSYSIASNPAGSAVYAANQTPTWGEHIGKAWVVRINAATNTASAPISLGPGWGPFVMAVAADGSACVGSNRDGGGTVTVIPSASATVGKHIRIHGSPQNIVIAP
jgi:DNA-binding beta-propeller fold protein YncE